LCWNEEALHLVWELQAHVLGLTDPVPKAVSLGRFRLPADVRVNVAVCPLHQSLYTRPRMPHALKAKTQNTLSKNSAGTQNDPRQIFTKFISQAIWDETGLFHFPFLFNTSY